MAKKLDESRPYGKVYGPTPIAFEQDHCYFNSQGKEIDKHGNLIGKKPSPNKVEDKAPEKKAEPEAPADEGKSNDPDAMDKDEIKGILKAMEVEFDGRAGIDDLRDLLKEEMTKREAA